MNESKKNNAEGIYGEEFKKTEKAIPIKAKKVKKIKNKEEQLWKTT